LPFYAIQRLPPYVFEPVNRIKAEVRAAAGTSSILQWETRICLLRPMSLRSCAKVSEEPEQADIPFRAVFRGFAARRLVTTLDVSM